MKRSAIILSALLMAALLLVGCGQKGPLYLPDDTNDSATEQAEKRVGKRLVKALRQILSR